MGGLSGRLASEAHASRLEWDAPFFCTCDVLRADILGRG